MSVIDDAVFWAAALDPPSESLGHVRVDQVHQQALERGRGMWVSDTVLDCYFIGDESVTVPYLAVKYRTSRILALAWAARRRDMHWLWLVRPVSSDARG